MDKEADAVVVGGGCTGASITYNLTRNGLTRAILLEKKHLNFGATGRSAGIIRTHYAHNETAKLALESLRFFQNFDSTMKATCGFVSTGFLLLVGEAGRNSLERNVAIQRRLGVGTRVLSKDELGVLEPRLYLDDIATAAFEPESGYAATDLTTKAFVDAARFEGAEILQGMAATKIKCEGREVRSVLTARDEIRTPIVILAASMWTRKLATEVGLDVPIRTRKSYLAFIERPKNFGTSHAVFADSIGGIYARPAGNQTWVGGVPEDRYGVEPDFFETTLPQSLVSNVIEKVTHRLPSIGNGTLLGGYVAVNDETPDDYPILSATQIRGLYIAAGFSGHGFKLSPAVGRVMSELVLRGEVSGIDIDAYRLSRFEEGQPIPANEGYSAQFFPRTQRQSS